MLGRALIALATMVGALVALLAVLAALGVLHAYRIPSSSMEPTFHCARPGAGCQAAHGDRVVALKYVLGSPARGDIVAFTTPPLAAVRCGAGGTFVKRIVGLPGDRWEERQGRVYLDGKPLAEPYVAAEDRDQQSQERGVQLDVRDQQPGQQLSDVRVRHDRDSQVDQ